MAHNDNMPHYRLATEAAEHIKKLIPDQLQSPETGIVCGSGLGGLVNTVNAASKVEIDYTDIPHFPQSTVQGHAGRLVIGTLGSKKTTVVLMVGRLHFYEGHSIQDTTFPIRVMKLLGIKTLIATNAAGGLNSGYEVGDVVILNDHVNLPGLSGCHPLRGPNIELFGPRFLPLSEAYDLSLRRKTHNAWKRLKVSDGRALYEGIYAFVSGPSYETRAECRLLRLLGADLVGMSTVPEVIVARHCGIKVLAISLVTNKAVIDTGLSGDDPTIASMDEDALRQHDDEGKADHEEVLQAGRQAASDIENLVRAVVEDHS